MFLKLRMARNDGTEGSDVIINLKNVTFVQDSILQYEDGSASCSTIHFTRGEGITVHDTINDLWHKIVDEEGRWIPER